MHKKHLECIAENENKYNIFENNIGLMGVSLSLLGFRNKKGLILFFIAYTRFLFIQIYEKGI